MPLHHDSHLLDLPLEIFQHIIYLSILARGFERGLRLRLVNHYFSEEVHRAIFLNNMLDEVLSVRGRLPPFTASYLEHRVTKEPSDGNPMLLCIRKVANQLTSDPKVARQYIKSLCALSVPQVRSAFFQFQPPWKALTQDTLEEHVKIAALYLKNEVAEHEHGYSCSLFGSSSRIVAQFGSKELCQLHLDRGTDLLTNRCFAVSDAVSFGRADLFHVSFNHRIESAPWGPKESRHEKVTLCTAWYTPSPQIWDAVCKIYQELGWCTDGYQNDTLRHCARKGRTEMVYHLLEKGCDPNAGISQSHLNKMTWRPIYIAAENGHTKVVEALLDKGAYITPDTVAAAASAGNLNLVKLLLTREAPTTGAVVAAAKRGYGDVVQFLLENGADANEDAGNVSALGYSVEKEHTRMFKCLLQHGASLPQAHTHDAGAGQANVKLLD